MNAEVLRIQKMLKRHWDGPMWHGGNLQELLNGINSQAAFLKPAGFKHNIYEYVLHMICWRRFTLENLKGNSNYKVELNSETDWITQYTPDEETWSAALEYLKVNQQELVAALDNLKDDVLDEMVPGKNFRWYVLLHGVLHHDIYHSAQIALLKKSV